MKQVFIKAWSKVVSTVREVAQKLRETFGELKTLFKGLASLKGAGIALAVVVGVLLVVAMIAVTAAAWVASQLGGPEWLQVVASVGITVGLTVVYLGLIKNFSVLLEFGKMLYSILKTGVTVLNGFKNMARAVFAVSNTAMALAVIGFIVEVVATIVFLLVVYLSGKVEFFSIAGRILLVESLLSLAVSSIVLSLNLVLFMLATITGAGVGIGVLIFALGFVLAVVSLVDIAALVLCKTGVWDEACTFSLTGHFISSIRRIFYRVGVLTEAGNDLLQIRGVDLLPLADQVRPLMSDGSAVAPVLHLRHWAKTPLYDPWETELSFNEYLATAPYEGTQNQTSFRYALGPYTTPVGEPELGEMTGEWFGWHRFGSAEYADMVSGRTVWRTYGLYALRADRVISATQAVTLDAGLNRRVVFWLTTGIALPGAECWFGFCSLDPVKTSDAFPIPLTLDVFPATLDELMAWTWDPNLPPLRDGDGDGLLAAARGGNDPDDVLWDTDGDGVSDLVELRWRQGGSLISPPAPIPTAMA